MGSLVLMYARHAKRANSVTGSGLSAGARAGSLRDPRESAAKCRWSGGGGACLDEARQLVEVAFWRPSSIGSRGPSASAGRDPMDDSRRKQVTRRDHSGSAANRRSGAPRRIHSRRQVSGRFHWHVYLAITTAIAGLQASGVGVGDASGAANKRFMSHPARAIP